MSISIKRIEFHEAGGGNIFYHGEDGYSLPADRVSVTVTFQVDDRRNQSMQLTEVMLGQYKNYDALVHAAYASLKLRLEGLSRIAEQIKTDVKAP